LHKGHDKPQKEGLLDGINRTVKVRVRFALSSAKNKMQQRSTSATDGGVGSQDGRNERKFFYRQTMSATNAFVVTVLVDLRGD
jgi:hypothetical protein